MIHTRKRKYLVIVEIEFTDDDLPWRDAQARAAELVRNILELTRSDNWAHEVHRWEVKRGPA